MKLFYFSYNELYSENACLLNSDVDKISYLHEVKTTLNETVNSADTSKKRSEYNIYRICISRICIRNRNCDVELLL